MMRPHSPLHLITSTDMHTHWRICMRAMTLATSHLQIMGIEQASASLRMLGRAGRAAMSARWSVTAWGQRQPLCPCPMPPPASLCSLVMTKWQPWMAQWDTALLLRPAMKYRGIAASSLNQFVTRGGNLSGCSSFLCIKRTFLHP